MTPRVLLCIIWLFVIAAAWFYGLGAAMLCAFAAFCGAWKQVQEDNGC